MCIPSRMNADPNQAEVKGKMLSGCCFFSISNERLVIVSLKKEFGGKILHNLNMLTIGACTI